MARRFFVDDKCVFGDQIVILGGEHQHISKVLRMKVGDDILVSSSKFEFECKIKSIEKQQTTAQIMRKTKIEDSSLPVAVFQAIMKNEHMDFVVQKCTELGIKTFVPFLSEFVVVKPDDKKIERLKRVSLEACKQSGRTVPMQIFDVQNFKQTLEMLKNFDQVVIAYEKDRTPAKEVLKSFDSKKSTALIVGSEGGFSENEIVMLKQSGAKVISLGKNILRGETAAVVLSSIALYEFDKFC